MKGNANSVRRDASTRRTPTTSTRHFTLREGQILALITEGRCNKEIAAELGLSPKTVSSHLGRIFARHGIHNRTQAALAWVSQK